MIRGKMMLRLRALFLLMLFESSRAARPDVVGLVYEAASISPALPAIAKRQSFTGTLGGTAPAITRTGDPDRPYGVDGDTFTDYASSAERSCNNQFNSCQEVANTDSSASFSVQDCQSQLTDCMSTESSTQTSSPTTQTETAATTTIPYDDEFDLVCDLT